MSEDATLPPSNRRSSDVRIESIEKRLDENTTMTLHNSAELAELRSEVATVDGKADTLLEMKQSFDNHLTVLCTYGRWTRRVVYGLLSVAGAALPIIVAAKQLGWL